MIEELLLGVQHAIFSEPPLIAINLVRPQHGDDAINLFKPQEVAQGAVVPQDLPVADQDYIRGTDVGRAGHPLPESCHLRVNRELGA